MWAGFIYVFECACTDQLTLPGLTRVLLSAGFKLSAEFPRSLCRALDDQDEVVLIAVRALGDMRSVVEGLLFLCNNKN